MANTKCPEGCTCGRHSRKKRGPRPDLAERNKSPEARSRPRVISEEARQRMSAERTKHGHSRSRGSARIATTTYHVWAAMIQRCTNPKNRDWKDYGGRGITVCDRWRDFAAFLVDMGEKPPGLTIERRNVNGDYDPDNCYWATLLEQARNKRNSHRD